MKSLPGKILSTFKQRDLNYSNYRDFLEKLTSKRFQVIPLRDIAKAEPHKIAIFIRHDIDYDLHGALKMAKIEYSYGFSCTYFVLHTARYFEHPGLITYLKILQDSYNHEIGWHNNINKICNKSINPVKYLKEKLNWLRENGIRITGFSNHKGQHKFCFGDYNDYFDYDAYNIGLSYIGNADCEFHNNRRWSPEDLVLDNRKEGEKIGILLHPIHWTNKQSILRHQLKYFYFAIRH